MDARKDRDEGFTLLEAVVAMVIFGIVAASTAAVLVRTVGGASDNRARIAAANVAAQTMDAIRQNAQTATGYTALQTATLTDVTVQNRTFQIFQSVAPVTGTNSGSPCTTGGITDQKFKRVSVEVRWANSGSVQPVRSDTIIQNPGVSADATKGALGVLVNGADGGPEPMVPVYLQNGTTALTDAAGCAYFDGLAPGTFTATANAQGYVDDSGNTTSSKTASVQKATATTVYLAYAPAATPTLNFTTVLADGTADASYAWPGNYSYVLKTSSKDRSGTSSSSSVTPSPGLYPFSSGYTSWMGGTTCGVTSQPINFATLEGQSSTVTVPTAGVTVTNSRSKQLVVTLKSTGCADISVTLPAGGSTKLSVPFGTWSATAPGGLLGLGTITATPMSVTLTQSAPTATVVL
jgi:prepilin-type N-terminal cleavage/methylation domain-containing protein